MKSEFTAIYERDGDWYIGYSPEIPGANGQGTRDQHASREVSNPRGGEDETAGACQQDHLAAHGATNQRPVHELLRFIRRTRISIGHHDDGIEWPTDEGCLANRCQFPDSLGVGGGPPPISETTGFSCSLLRSRSVGPSAYCWPP